MQTCVVAASHPLPSATSEHLNETERALLGMLAADIYELSSGAWVIAADFAGGSLLPVSVLGNPPGLENWLVRAAWCLSGHGSSGLRQIGSVREPQPLVCPVLAYGRTVAAILAGPRLDGTPFQAADRQLLTEGAAQLGKLLENDRLAVRAGSNALAMDRTRRELEVAREVQGRLFPTSHPRVKGLDYSGESHCAYQVGGDFFNFTRLRESRLSVAIGDVCGKGIPAAILMAGLQASLRIIVRVGSPGVLRVVRQLNRIIADISPGNFYVTMFLAEIDAAEGRMTYVNAGHEPPLLLRADGRVERLEEGGTVLGLTSRSRYQCGIVDLSAGDALIGFTDGITEATNAEGLEMTEEGILKAVRNCADRSADVLVDAILRYQQRYTGDVPASDDRTVVVVRSTADRSLPHYACERAAG